MKTFAFVAALFALTAGLVAEPPPADVSEGGGQPTPIRDVFPRFSVVGEWRVTHPWWTDNLTLRADGTMVTQRQGSTGHWILTGDGGTPVIVLRWDAYGTESAAMIAPNHFRGQIENGRFMDMQRGETTALDKAAPAGAAAASR